MELSAPQTPVGEPAEKAGASPRRSPMFDRPGYRLIKVGELAMATAERALEPLGVRPRHFNVLATLAADPTLSQQDVSQLLSIDANVLVGVIDDLERQGLAERRRNPRDRRRHLVTVTPAGRRLLREGVTALDAAESAFFAGVSGPDLLVLREVTGHLIASHPPPVKR